MARGYDCIESPYLQTEGEFARVNEDVLPEQTRGSEPQYRGDVERGDKLRPAFRGPLREDGHDCLLHRCGPGVSSENEKEQGN
jgi:hypothetical protein